MKTPEILYSVKAQRGNVLRCKGWRQEVILRMLENNMENAEKPEELVIYGGIGKAARNWESYHAIVDSLKNLEDDETLVVQSGMPVAIFKTHKYAPTVVMATTNIMKADWPTFYDLQDKNLTMYANYTAAPWEYIGTQGVIQGTFETLSAIARLHYNDSLVGKILLTAGAGGMGGNQTRAMTMHGGVAILCDSNIEIINRRIEKGFIDVVVESFDKAVSLAKEKAEKGEAIGIAVVGNAADIFEESLEKNFLPDITTSMTPAHDPFAYLPANYTVEEAEALRKSDRDKYLVEARKTMVRELNALIKFLDLGVNSFEYGTSIRKECIDAGMDAKEAKRLPGFVAEYIRPLFCEGRGPFRWICMSGEAEDLRKIDDMILEKFSDDLLVTRWIKLAKEHIPIEALPARICYMGFGQRKKFALEVNDMIRKGELSGPVAFSRDNLDSGSIVNPTFESENMKDGGDLISDWPVLNGLLNAVGMCDLIALQANYSMGEAVHTGVTMIADGTEEADMRLEVAMTVDSGIGVIRHAQAGYETAKEVANGKGKLTNESIQVPLWWEPTATFGPKDVKKTSVLK
ncbi:urocanate hydratase [Viridibacillus sp. FSL H8-0110]|uniref:urocanate hydratase n=1 Tax=Viridibacillus sp. FSL H8-0110 TaxID=2921376 RepID=UPI0030F4E8E5